MIRPLFRVDSVVALIVAYRRYPGFDCRYECSIAGISGCHSFSVPIEKSKGEAFDIAKAQLVARVKEAGFQVATVLFETELDGTVELDWSKDLEGALV